MNNWKTWRTVLLACITMIAGGYVFYTTGQNQIADSTNNNLKKPERKRSDDIADSTNNNLKKPERKRSDDLEREVKDGVPDMMRFMRKKGRLHDLPDEESVQNMSKTEAEYIFFSYISNINHLCRRLLRMGKMEDGGWYVCDDFEFRPIAPCITYSFGIQFDFSYDKDVQRLYRCHVYSFDPSMGEASHNVTPLIHFYDMGLRGNGTYNLPMYTIIRNKPRYWDLRTFSQIREMLGHENRVIDLLKMDIEWGEWFVLPDLFRTGALKQVRQLQIELHLHKSLPLDVLEPALAMLRQLELAGFKRIHTHKNPWCKLDRPRFVDIQAYCYELSFVNSKFVRE